MHLEAASAVNVLEFPAELGLEALRHTLGNTAGYLQLG